MHSSSTRSVSQTGRPIFHAGLLLASGLIVAGVLLFPARQAPDNSLPALTPETTENAALDSSRDRNAAQQAAVTAQDQSLVAASGIAATASCNHDPSLRTLQHYRQLSAQDWRRLNQWQQERGLSQTRLRADNELMQEPSPYLHYDTGSLESIASSGDADAQYWLAMKYRDSGAAKVPSEHGSEDAQLVIAKLLQQAASAGHVQAMQTISQRYYEQLQATNAAADFPDLQIKARAWTRVAAWRLGQLADASSALPQALESQAAQLASQLIDELQQQRQQQGLPAFNNVVPDAVIGLLQAGSTEHCRRIAQASSSLQQLAD